MAVLQRLIEELKLDADATNKSSMHLESLNLKLYMRLDYSAVQALQIFPKKMQKRVLASNETLFDILNRCRTSIGTRCLKRWMKQPLQDPAGIERRLQFLDYFIENSEMRKFIQSEVLNRICDLDKLYFTFYKVHSDKPAKCEMADLLRLYKLIKALNDFKKKLESRKSDRFVQDNLYEKVESTSRELEKPATMIENNIVMEGIENEYYIKPTTQASLKKLMKEKEQLQADIKEEFEDVKQDLGISMELSTSTGQLFLFEGEKGAVSDAIRSNSRYRMMTVRGKKATFTSLRLTDLCSELNKLNE
jgi:DNA mismatch repair protein MSH2